MGLKLSELKAANPSIMNRITFPSMFDDKHMVIMTEKGIRDRIYQHCKHFATIFDNEDECAEAFQGWSAVNAGRWEDLFKTLIQKYEIVHNYDRTEERTEKHSSSGKTEKSGSFSNNSENSGTTTTSGSVKDETSGNKSVEHSGTNISQAEHLVNNEKVGAVSAYNVDSFQNKERQTENATNNDSETVTTESAETATTSESGERTISDNVSAENSGRTSGSSMNSESVTRSGEVKHTVRAFGNIGVTTSQKMLREEREIAVFSFSDFILKEFKQEFCILVY